MANSCGKDGHVSCPAKELERFNLKFLEIAILKGYCTYLTLKFLNDNIFKMT